MSGICFIIPNSDFSNSPLGQVTVIGTDEEIAEKIVDNFITALGDESDKQAVYEVVVGMVKTGLWDKTLMFYPILGSTLEQKCIALKGENLVLLSNASNDEKKISFVNSISETSYPGILPEHNFKVENRSVIARINALDVASTVVNGVLITRSTSSGSSERIIGVCFQTSAILHTNTRNCRISYTQETTGEALLMQNGVSFKSYTGTYGELNRFPCNIVGAAVAANKAISSPYSGTLSYLIYGNYNKDELQIMDELMANFELNVGK